MLEILAPCGGAESLEAAIKTGADAVYLGASAFSARRNAENFDDTQLFEAVKLCHYSGVKVYVTLNTLVHDEELPQLEETIKSIDKSMADAVIVQDFGVAKKVSQIAPRLHLHASTQMTITSVSGAEFARRNGFTRAVLARELSMAQIEEIVKNVDIETEVFVHGALCVCVSGQCYMSAMLGGRSGNRGLCAQPCRLNFSSSGRENVLSLKDLSLLDHLRELSDMGVTSAKIEGRMKRPEYVAAAVNACKCALDGKPYDLKLLSGIFSRSGFTEGYYNDDFKNMQGVRTKEDVEAAPKAITQLHELYKAPYKRYTVDFDITVKHDEPISVSVSCEGLKLSIKGDIPQTAVNRELTFDEVKLRFEKLGGTIYNAGNVTALVESGLSVTASQLNELRRTAVDSLSEKILEKNTRFS